VEKGNPANGPQCICFELDAACTQCEVYAEALTLVLEAAKRPSALGKEERKTLETHRTNMANAARLNLEFGAQKFPDMPRTQAIRDDALEKSRNQQEVVTALSAVLSLAVPFTREELRWLKEVVPVKHYYRSDQDKADAFHAKLDAMLSEETR